MFLEKEMRFSFFKIKNRCIFDNALGTSGKRQYAHTNFVDLCASSLLPARSGSEGTLYVAIMYSRPGHTDLRKKIPIFFRSNPEGS